MYISSPSPASLPSPHPILKIITKHQTGLPILDSNFSPALHLTPNSVYKLMLLSPVIPFSHPPTMSISPFSTSAFYIFQNIKIIQYNFQYCVHNLVATWV